MSSAGQDDTDQVAGGVLRDLRRCTGLTQRQVSDLAEVPPSVLRAYEAGTRQPSLGELIRIVEAAGLELRLHLDTRDRHDELLAKRTDPDLMRALAAEERERVARLNVERLARSVAPDLFEEVTTWTPDRQQGE
jgi:transcriptional regulator with XRE-family HTH domain